jgi:hypothetical protein
VALHPSAKTEVLLSLLLTQAFDLYQVGKHSFILVLAGNVDRNFCLNAPAIAALVAGACTFFLDDLAHLVF